MCKKQKKPSEVDCSILRALARLGLTERNAIRGEISCLSKLVRYLERGRLTQQQRINRHRLVRQVFVDGGQDFTQQMGLCREMYGTNALEHAIS